jgi:hypothetical protein
MAIHGASRDDAAANQMSGFETVWLTSDANRAESADRSPPIE